MRRKNIWKNSDSQKQRDCCSIEVSPSSKRLVARTVPSVPLSDLFVVDGKDRGDVETEHGHDSQVHLGILKPGWPACQ